MRRIYFMKRLPVLTGLAAAIIGAVVVALAGCRQAPSGTAAGGGDQTADPSVAQADAQETSDHPESFRLQTRRLISSGEVPLLEQINRENERVVAAAAPGVVRITAMGPVDPHAQLFGDLPFKIPGLPQGFHPTVPSYGSGVIISRDGYIVTNYHVVEDAQSVEVQLHDQRTFAARVVASDSLSDIAVLKIDATDLPALPWGDSDKVEVGEQVFAIGNPFNLEDSVSKGIVSAKGRRPARLGQLRGVHPDGRGDQRRQLGRGAGKYSR